MNRVLSFVEARRVVEQQAAQVRPTTSTETLSLLEACGRVLAQAVVADRDFPPFARSTRDGFAVRSADLAQVPARLSMVGEVKAGGPADLHYTLSSGQCVEIMTGAPVPDDADAVVMVEDTVADGGTIQIMRGIGAGENVVPRGSEARAGQELLAAGARLDHAAIAAAASAGYSQVRVWAKPKVAVLATGDELVEVGAHPAPHQVRNSNTYSVAAQVSEAGACAELLGIALDDPDELRRLITRGLNADLLLLTGGVSMGKYDLVEQVLEEMGAEFFFTGAKLQPGKPVVFGHVPATTARASGSSNPKLFFGLPGNPISTMVTFDLFVRPVLDALSGALPTPLLYLQARLKTEFRTRTGLTRFLPALLTGEFEHCEVQPVRWQGSGDFTARARANCYLVVPPDRERIPAGELVSVLKL